MKTRPPLIVPVALSIVCLLAVFVLTGQTASPPKKTSESKAGVVSPCSSCHKDLNKALPGGHEAVSGKDISSCLKCHKPDMTGKPVTNVFSARIHLGHVYPNGGTDCMTCHYFSAGKRFEIKGFDKSLGAPSKEDFLLVKDIVSSIAKTGYTAFFHARKGVMCAGCHGRGLPKSDDTVENDRCIECHGPKDVLSKKTEPKELKDRNPHESHLGEIACTVCHKAHKPSKVYCLDCHKAFQMSIQGAGRC
jgi:hypothetical protein